MRPGRLRHVVKIQNATYAADAHGDEVETLSDAETVRASIEPLQGRERWLAQQVESEVTVRIRIRYHSEVTQQSRIIFGTRKYEVLNVIDPQERHREMELLCKEVDM